MKKQYNTIILSDIHLGSDNCNAKALNSLLEKLIDKQIIIERLILNGDVFDSLDFRRLKKNHWKVLSNIRHLSDKIDVVWICGNHDVAADIISHLIGVSIVEDFIFTSGGKNIYVSHGHQYDDFLDKHPIITYFADCIYWILQKIDPSHFISKFAKHNSKTFVRCTKKVEIGATKKAKEKECHIAICGHTHSPEITKNDGIIYCNSGCWTEKNCTYLAIKDGAITLESFS